MEENVIGSAIIGCAVKVHRALGPGLLESVYETCLAHEIRKFGLGCEIQVALPITYDGILIEPAFRLDLLVQNLVVLEIKAIDRIVDVHRAQLLSYLKLGGYRLGYLLNFKVALMKDGINRMANGL